MEQDIKKAFQKKETQRLGSSTGQSDSARHRKMDYLTECLTLTALIIDRRLLTGVAGYERFKRRRTLLGPRIRKVQSQKPASNGQIGFPLGRVLKPRLQSSLRRVRVSQHQLRHTGLRRIYGRVKGVVGVELV